MGTDSPRDGSQQVPVPFAASWIAGPRANLSVTVIEPRATVAPFICVRAGGLLINLSNAADADYLAALITKAAADLRAVETKEGKR